MAGMNQPSGDGMFENEQGSWTQFGAVGPDMSTSILAISGPRDNEGATTYEFEVSGTVAQGQVDGGADQASGSHAEGRVGGGTDRWYFSGELLSLSVGGTREAAFRLNGNAIDPSNYSGRTSGSTGSGGSTSGAASGSTGGTVSNGQATGAGGGAMMGVMPGGIGMRQAVGLGLAVVALAYLVGGE